MQELINFIAATGLLIGTSILVTLCVALLINWMGNRAEKYDEASKKS